MPLSATPSAKLASMEMVQSAGKTVLMAWKNVELSVSMKILLAQKQ
jgi:hypothetical protein